MNTFNGMQIIEDASLVDITEDWSQVRSPARARRRRRKYPQRITVKLVPKREAYSMGNKLIMHPEMAKELCNRIDRLAARSIGKE